MGDKLCGRGTCRGCFSPPFPYLNFQRSHFSWTWIAVFYLLVTEWVLNSALDGGERSTSHPTCYTPRERIPGTHWVVSWMDPRASLVFWRREKISLACQVSNIKMYSLWLCFYQHVITANWNIMCWFQKILTNPLLLWATWRSCFNTRSIKIRGSIPLLPLYIFMVWTGTTLPLSLHSYTPHVWSAAYRRDTK